MSGRTVSIAAAAVLAGCMTLAFVAAKQRAMRTEDELVPGYPDAVTHSPGRGLWAFFGHMAFAIYLFLVLLLSPAQPEPKTLALLGAAGAYVLAGVWLASEAAPWAYAARRLAPEREGAVSAATGGRIRRVWITPYPMVAGPIGTVATVAGRSLFLWSPAGRLTPDEIAGGAPFRSARRRTWPAGIAAVWLARLYETAFDVSVARWSMWGLAGASALTGIVAEGRWLRARRQLESTPDKDLARAAIVGTLRIGREQARLSAAGSLAGAGVPRLPTIAELIWRRTLAQASRIAREAGVAPGFVSDTVVEIASREGPPPSPPGGPPPLPEIPKGAEA